MEGEELVEKGKGKEVVTEVEVDKGVDFSSGLKWELGTLFGPARAEG